MNLNVFDYLPLTILVTYNSMNYSSQMESLTKIFNYIDNFVDDSESDVRNNNPITNISVIKNPYIEESFFTENSLKTSVSKVRSARKSQVYNSQTKENNKNNSSNNNQYLSYNLENNSQVMKTENFRDDEDYYTQKIKKENSVISKKKYSDYFEIGSMNIKLNIFIIFIIF